MNGPPYGRRILLEAAALHQGGMQVEVVWHDSRPDDSYGHVQHACLAEMRRQQSLSHLSKTGVRLGKHKNLDEVTNRDGGNQYYYNGLDRAHSEALQSKQQ